MKRNEGRHEGGEQLLLADDRWFDETIGLGARHNGGEDTDYVTRAYLNARCSFTGDIPLVGHPETNTESLARYYPGTALAIAKHACRKPEVMVQFLRKFAVGCVLSARGDMNVRALVPALIGFKQAVSERLLIKGRVGRAGSGGRTGSDDASREPDRGGDMRVP